jgi:hypothetical protein
MRYHSPYGSPGVSDFIALRLQDVDYADTAGRDINYAETAGRYVIGCRMYDVGSVCRMCVSYKLNVGGVGGVGDGAVPECLNVGLIERWPHRPPTPPALRYHLSLCGLPLRMIPAGNWR